MKISRTSSFVPKGKYELTAQKCKDLIQDMKNRLREMIDRYNTSGNGSDMLIHDYDSDDECGIIDNESTYGRFNKKRATKRDMKSNNTGLAARNGDDRSSFLRHNPPKILYWGHSMDTYNLLFFTCAKLDDDNGVTSDKTPGPSSRHNKRHKTGDDPKVRNKNKLTDVESQQLTVQREMSNNVHNISKSMESVANAHLATQKNRMEGERFNLWLKMLEAESSNQHELAQLYKERLNEITKNIQDYDFRLEGSDAGPKRINFGESNGHSV